MAAKVGLLTRNIQIIGDTYPKMEEEAFGVRVLVGSYVDGTKPNTGDSSHPSVLTHVRSHTRPCSRLSVLMPVGLMPVRSQACPFSCLSVLRPVRSHACPYSCLSVLMPLRFHVRLYSCPSVLMPVRTHACRTHACPFSGLSVRRPVRSHACPYSRLSVLMPVRSHACPFSCLSILMPVCTHACPFSCLSVLMPVRSHACPYSCLSILMPVRTHACPFSCLSVLMYVSVARAVRHGVALPWPRGHSHSETMYSSLSQQTVHGKGRALAVSHSQKEGVVMQ